jgi:hypothetical protein
LRLALLAAIEDAQQDDSVSSSTIREKVPPTHENAPVATSHAQVRKFAKVVQHSLEQIDELGRSPHAEIGQEVGDPIEITRRVVCDINLRHVWR